jgi:DNA-binding FadR family transcriptional regulator
MEPLGSPPEQHLAEGPVHWSLLSAFRSHDPKTAHDAMLGMLIQYEEMCRRAVPASS